LDGELGWGNIVNAGPAALRSRFELGRAICRHGVRVLNEHGCDYEPLTTSRAGAGGEQNGQTTTTTSNDASNLAARRRQQRTLITAYDEARTPSTEGVPTT